MRAKAYERQPSTFLRCVQGSLCIGALVVGSQVIAQETAEQDERPTPAREARPDSELRGSDSRDSDTSRDALRAAEPIERPVRNLDAQQVRETETRDREAREVQPGRETRETREPLENPEQTEPAPSTETEVRPGAIVAPRPEPQPDEQEPQPQQEPRPQEEPQPEREPQPEEELTPDAEEDPEAGPEPVLEPSPGPEPESAPELERPPEPETGTEPEPEPDIEPEQAPEPGDADSETAPEAEQEPAPSRPPMRSGGSLLNDSMAPPPIPVPPVRQAQTNDPVKDPSFLPHEPGELLLVSADMAEAQRTAQLLQGYQLQLTSREPLDNLGLVISVFRLPPGAQAPALVAQLRSDLPDLDIDTNQRYQPLNARREYGQRMIDWPESVSTCAGDFRIGLLDTQVEDQHPALIGTALAQRNFARGESASAEHGTAIASLLIGQPESLAPGLLPGSELFAAGVFRQRGTPADPVVDTTTEMLLGALDWLASEQVQAINLSLGGERNQVFELALKQLLERDIHLIAAAGNQGPDAPPVFPAAQPGVIAVTAVDAAGQLYADANHGDYIDLAAPGVDVWSADGDTGGRYHSGTSFAAPFVTAALLLAEHQGDDLLQSLKALKPSGRDNQLGWGIVKIDGGCP